jgi:hypothetical protein
VWKALCWAITGARDNGTITGDSPSTLLTC